MEISIEQGTVEWKTYRKTKVTASEVSIILGESPYKTALQLFNEKQNDFPDEIGFQLQKGQSIEPIARRIFENEVGAMFPPKVFVSDSVPFLMASLDGYNSERNELLEVKFQGRKIHLSGEIPRHYMLQMQCQLYVSEASCGWFVSYNKDVIDDPYRCQRVEHNRSMQLEIVKAAKKFYDNLMGGFPPEPCERDIHNIDEDTFLAAKIVEYNKTKVIIDHHEKVLEDLKKEIAECLDQEKISKAKFRDTTLTKVFKQGSISYSKIPEIKGMDLEKYRGKPTVYWTIK